MRVGNPESFRKCKEINANSRKNVTIINMNNTNTFYVALRKIWEKNWPEVQAGFKGGLPKFIFSRNSNEYGPGIPVFCYHIVNEKDFEADLKFLSQNGYETIDADSLIDHLKKRKFANRRSVVLTFDDGGRNLHDVAFPLLKDYGMRAVAFIATRFHQEGTDQSHPRTVHTQALPLSWSQIREMHSSGIIDFQSHTHEHRYIPRWPEPAGLEGSDDDLVGSLRKDVISIEEDFILSREIFKQKLNKTVRHLAFPCFNGTEKALQIGQSLGYEGFWWGVLPYRPLNEPGQSPLYIVRIGARYLRRLPGDGREPFKNIIRERYGHSVLRLLDFLKTSIGNND